VALRVFGVCCSVSLQLSVQFTVCDPPAGCEQLPAVSVPVLYVDFCLDVAHCRHKTQRGVSPLTHCNSVPVSRQMCAHLYHV